MASSDAQPVPNLRDLIDQFIDRTGHSRRWIGDHSTISHQTLGYWHGGTIKVFPDPGTLREFARVAGLTEHVVTLAAARTLGLKVGGETGLAAALPPSTDKLTDEQVAAIAGLIRVFTEPTKRGRLTSVPAARQVEPPARTGLLREVGAAARDGDDPELSDADDEVHP